MSHNICVFTQNITDIVFNITDSLTTLFLSGSKRVAINLPKTKVVSSFSKSALVAKEFILVVMLC
jgi:hypothetical protein